MKKDSFTFSDKLKKSKTLPLSKRIPSRVGGEVKAKRTLFERAQRDLPFIIVAALALLLLPFLSRESGDIDTASVVWPGEESIAEPVESGGRIEDTFDVSNYRNPLDLIIRRGEGDSAKDTIDTYGAGSGESDEYGSSASRSSYGSEEYSTSPATSRYGKTAKRTVRSSVTRTPTAIGAFRPGSMAAPNNSSGASHSMAFGSRTKDAAPKVQGPGVRPVALQPLTAAGKGRDLTGGDNLYAEAARSIGAMNTPGAKQALMDAQLKDVDGKPLDYSKAAAADAGAKGPGAGGNLANNWSHTPIKPWWWDMMKQRSQMRWELWHYNWEKMASDSLIKLTAGLASCLITGSPDFSVGKFLGTDGSDPDGKCVDAAGKEVYIRRRQYIRELKVDGGKDSAGSAVSALPWEEACVKYGHGTVVMKPGADHKSWFETRLNCLGIGLSDIKDKYENRRSGVCHLDQDPMSVDIIVERNGKHRTNLVKHMGYYIVSTKQLNSSVDDNACKANKDDKGNPDGTFSCNCVTYIKKADYGRNVLPKIDEEKDGELKAVVVYKVGSYTLLDDAYLKTDDVVVDDKKYHETFAVAKALTESPNTQCLTEDRLKEIMKPLGEWRTGDYHNTRLNEIARCPASSFRHTYYEPVKLAPDYSTTSSTYDEAYMEDCRTHDVYIEKVPEKHRFTTTIQKPGKTTIAYVVEHVQGASYEDYVKKDSALADNTGWIVRERIVYSEEKNLNTHWMKKNSDGSITFIGEAEVGLASTETTDSNAKEDDDGKATRKKAFPGFGKIIWVTTNETEDYGINRGGFVVEPESSLLFSHPAKAAVCNYRWGCTQGELCMAFEDSSNKVCYKVDADGNPALDTNGKKIYYKAFPSSTAGGYMLIEKPMTRVDEDTLERIDHIGPCAPLCKTKEGEYRFLDSESGAKPSEADLEKIDLKGYPNCPECNPSPVKILPTTGLVCVDPEKEDEPCPCIKVDNPVTPANINPLYVRSDVSTATPQEVELPVTPICALKAIALGNIYLRKSDGTAGEKVNPDDDIVQMLLTKSPADREKLCPFCNPADEDAGLCHINNVVYPSVSFKGIDGQTYHIRKSETPIEGTTSYPCTPICAAKAKALGIFQTEGIDSTVPTDPESPLTENQNDISPVQPGTPLCPYCNPDPGEEPVPEQPNYTDIKIGPCEYQLIGEYFWNASYDLKTQLPLAHIYEVMHDCDNPIIEGHASKTTVTDDNNNNKRLSFDRAMEVAKQVQAEWARHGVNLQVTPTSDGFGRYAGVAPDRYWVQYRSWPKKRNTISNPSNATETVTIYGVGDRDAQFQRPPLPRGKKKWPAADEANYRLQESKDRKVIIKGTVRTK